MKMTLLTSLLCAAVITGTASAAPAIIDFATGSAVDNGTLTYLGGAGPLVGANIGIGSVRGINTPSNAGVTNTTVVGILSFTTGAFISYNAVEDKYNFGPGGSLTITGTGPGCLTIGACGGNSPNAVAGPTLLSGTVISASYQAGAFEVALAAGNDVKDILLTRFFGFADNTPFNFSGTIHASLATGGGGGAFTANSTASTDIRNQAVPEPAAVVFLGTILIGLTGLMRRRSLMGKA